MNLDIDSYFTIGKGHNVCQDFCIHIDYPYPIVILSDGCSSSPNTDIGSRILCLSARKYLDILDYNPINFIKYVVNHSLEVCINLGLEESCLFATLSILRVIKKRIKIIVFGDGGIILRNDNNDIYITNISYNENCPYYPLHYVINPKQNKNKKQIKQTDIFNNKEMRSWYWKNNDGSHLLDVEKPSTFEYEPLYIKQALICSDGLFSFNSEIESLAQNLFDFKSTKGFFIKRRIKRGLEQLYKSNIYNNDDIAIGGICLNS